MAHRVGVRMRIVRNQECRRSSVRLPQSRSVSRKVAEVFLDRKRKFAKTEKMGKRCFGAILRGRTGCSGMASNG